MIVEIVGTALCTAVAGYLLGSSKRPVVPAKPPQEDIIYRKDDKVLVLLQGSWHPGIFNTMLYNSELKKPSYHIQLDSGGDPWNVYDCTHVKHAPTQEITYYDPKAGYRDNAVK